MTFLGTLYREVVNLLPKPTLEEGFVSLCKGMFGEPHNAASLIGAFRQTYQQELTQPEPAQENGPDGRGSGWWGKPSKQSPTPATDSSAAALVSGIRQALDALERLAGYATQQSQNAEYYSRQWYAVSAQLESAQQRAQAAQQAYEAVSRELGEEKEKNETLQTRLAAVKDERDTAQQELAASREELKETIRTADERFGAMVREKDALLEEKTKEAAECVRHLRRVHAHACGLQETDLVFREWQNELSLPFPLSPARCLYDSARDEASARAFFSCVRSRSNVAVCAFTADGFGYGGFYHGAVTRPQKEFNDPDIFLFSFTYNTEERAPRAFPVLQNARKDVFVQLFSKGDLFVWFGSRTCGMGIGMEKSRAFCINVADKFSGVTDRELTGVSSSFVCGPYIQIVRIVAIQF